MPPRRAAADGTALARGDILEYIKLIDDPTHTANEDGTYNLSETQARAILDLRLQRLTQLGVKEVTDELQELAGKIKEYLAILASRERIMQIITDELKEVREQFAVPRRTEIVDWSGDMDDEDLIEREDMVVTVTQAAISSARRSPISARRSAAARACRGCRPRKRTWSPPSSWPTPIRSFCSSPPTGWPTSSRHGGLPLGRAHVKGKAIVNILPIPQGRVDRGDHARGCARG
jgi:DNA gyrase subunit A